MLDLTDEQKDALKYAIKDRIVSLRHYIFRKKKARMSLAKEALEQVNCLVQLAEQLGIDLNDD